MSFIYKIKVDILMKFHLCRPATTASLTSKRDKLHQNIGKYNVMLLGGHAQGPRLMMGMYTLYFTLQAEDTGVNWHSSFGTVEGPFKYEALPPEQIKFNLQTRWAKSNFLFDGH